MADLGWLKRTAVVLIGLAIGFAAAQETEFAGLRLAHLSPDAPLIDLLIDGELMLRDLEFSEVSAYLFIAPGRHELEVFPHRAPARIDDGAQANGAQGDGRQTGEPVRPLEPFTISVELAPDRYYTVGLAGYFEPPASRDEMASLRIEFGEGSGISVQVQGPRGYLVSLNREQTLNGLEPGSYTVRASGEGLRSAEYKLDIAASEVTTLPISLQQGEASSEPEVVNSAGQSEAREEGVWHRSQLQLYEDSPGFPPAGYAYLRVIHAAPGVGAVDVSSVALSDAGAADTGRNATTSDKQALLSDLAFPNASDYVAVAVGTKSFEVNLAGTDFGFSSLREVSLTAGTLYTFYLTGSLNEQSLTPLPSVDAVLRVGPED